MPMGMRAITVAVLACWSASDARAATKLCVTLPGSWMIDAPGAIDVPEEPRLVLPVWRTDRNSFHVTVARRGEGGEPIVRAAAFSVEAIDEQNALVTVEAADGDWILDPGSVGQHVCSKTVLRVRRDWQAARPEPAVLLRDGGIELVSAPGDPLSWTRLDWAYAQDAFARDLHGSLGFDSTWIRPAPDRAIVLRLVRFWPDGARVDALRAVAGAAPRQPVCAGPRLPRAVPRAAEFLVARRHAAFTTGGDRLATRTRFDHDAHRTRLSVEVPDGIAFELRELPIASPCSALQPLVVTAERSRDEPPRVVGVDMEEPRWEPGTPLDVRIADAGTWGLVEVAWSPTADGIANGEAPRFLATADTIQFYGSAVEAERASAAAAPDPIGPFTWLPVRYPVVHLSVTPLWPDGARGVAWTGRLEVDPDTRLVTVTSTPGRIAPAAEPATTGPARSLADRALVPLVLLLLLLGGVWLRARRHGHTGAPPPG